MIEKTGKHQRIVSGGRQPGLAGRGRLDVESSQPLQQLRVVHTARVAEMDRRTLRDRLDPFAVLEDLAPNEALVFRNPVAM